MQRALFVLFVATATACGVAPYPFNPQFTRAAPAAIDPRSGTELSHDSRLSGTVTQFTEGRVLVSDSWASGDWVLVHYVGGPGLTLDFRPAPAFDRYFWLDLAKAEQRELTVPADVSLQLAAHEAGAPATLVAPLSRAFFRVNGDALTRLPDAPLAVPDGLRVLARADGSIVYTSSDGARHTLVRFDGTRWTQLDTGEWWAITLDDTRVRLARWEPGQLCVELRTWPGLVPMGSRDCVFTSLFTEPVETAVWHGSPDEFAVLLGRDLLHRLGWSQPAFFYDGVLHAPEFAPIGIESPRAWPDEIAAVPGQMLVWNNLREGELRGLSRYSKGRPVEVLAPLDTAGRDCACDRNVDLTCACLRRNFTDFHTLLAQQGKTQVVTVLDPFEFEQHLFVKTAPLPRTGHLFLDYDLSCFMPQGVAPCGTDSTSFCAVVGPGGVGPACLATHGRLSDPGLLPIEQKLVATEGRLHTNDTGLSWTLEFLPGSNTDGGPKYPHGYLDAGISDEGTGFVAINPFDARARITYSAPGYEPVYVDLEGTYEQRVRYTLPLSDARPVYLPKGVYVPGVTASTASFVRSAAADATLARPGTWLTRGADGGVAVELSPMPPPNQPWPAGCRTADRFMRAQLRQSLDGTTAVLIDFERRSITTRTPPTGLVPCFAPSSPVISWEGREVWSFEADGGVLARGATIPAGLRSANLVSNDGEVLLFQEPVREDGGTALQTRLATWNWRTDAWTERGVIPGNVLATPYKTLFTSNFDAALIVGPPLAGSTSTASSLFTWYPLDGVSAPIEVTQVARVRPSASAWLLLDTPQGLKRFNPRTAQTVAVPGNWRLPIDPYQEALTWTNGVLLWDGTSQTATLDLSTGTVTPSPNLASTLIDGVVLGDRDLVFLDDARSIPAMSSGVGFRVSNVGGVVTTSGGTGPGAPGLGNTPDNPWGTFGAPCEPYGSNDVLHLANHPNAPLTSEGLVFCQPR
ncbi:MAG: hypothetical protein U0228_11175 [Myxococcaceae bacterium]